MKRVYRLVILAALLLPGSALAGYCVSWVAPTENTDGSELLPEDISGFQLWVLKAFQADGVTPRTYGTPSIQPGDARQYCNEWAGPGEWKAKMRTVHVNGQVSADSIEVFFTLVDPDGDGNAHVESGVIPPLEPLDPGAPDPVVVECPATTGGEACPELARQNVFTVTRKGYWTISGPDGVWLTKPDGSTRQTTTRDEAYEWISKDGRSGAFIINPPPFEVLYQ